MSIRSIDDFIGSAKKALAIQETAKKLVIIIYYVRKVMQKLNVTSLSYFP